MDGSHTKEIIQKSSAALQDFQRGTATAGLSEHALKYQMGKILYILF